MSVIDVRVDVDLNKGYVEEIVSQTADQGTFDPAANLIRILLAIHGTDDELDRACLIERMIEHSYRHTEHFHRSLGAYLKQLAREDKEGA
jgi:hypothetical protein